MKIKLSSKIISFLPGVRYTVILIKQAANLRKVSNLSQLLRGTAVVAKNDLKKPERKDLFERITNISTDTGATFLESYLMDARFKKVLAGKDIEGQNNLQNLVSWLSLKYFLPLYGFDLDQAEKDYYIDFYEPKKGKKAPELDFIPETTNLVIFFPNLGGWQNEQIDALIDEINLNLSKYLQTQVSEVYQLDSEHTEVDLGYQSELEVEYLNKKAEEEAAAGLEAEQAAAREKLLSEPSSPTVSSAYAPSLPTRPEAAEVLQEWLQNIVKNDFPQFLEPAETPLSAEPTSPASSLQELVEVENPREAGHGDLSTNLAMKLAKKLGQSPQEIAKKIQEELEKHNQSEENPFIEKIETVGPGFINFHLSSGYFQERLEDLLELKDQYGRSNLGNGQKIMIEFGSLNMAKPFGAHHFLTTIIGQTLVNLYRLAGYEVLAGDYPGDWGTQFGKSIYAYRHWGDKDTVERDPMNELLKLYVKFHEEAEKDPSLEDAARLEFKKLEEGDEENTKLWKWLVEVTNKDLEAIYQTMGVHHDRCYPESKYNQACQSILERGKALGVFIEGERGAFIADLEAQNLPPALVQKGDGTTLYITRDIASIEDRLTGEKDLKRLVYVVDVAQTLHFKQLFATAHKFHQADPAFPIAEFKHVPFGRMSFADASMSTRKGNIIQGKEIIREAYDRADQMIKQKFQESGQELSSAETKKLVHGMAIGAIKYAMLCQAPESDFTYDWDRVISLEGNSAPYLQYTLARSHSILRKAAENLGDSLATAAHTALQTSSNNPTPNPKSASAEQGQITLFSLDEEQKASAHQAEIAASETELTPFCLPTEQALLRLLTQFPQKVAAAAENYKPNTLTNYLHELAQTFNSFYGSVPVLKAQRTDLRQARLDLVRATAQVLKNGLQALGIATFERM